MAAAPGSYISLSSESDTLTFRSGLAAASPLPPGTNASAFTAASAAISLTALPSLRPSSSPGPGQTEPLLPDAVMPPVARQGPDESAPSARGSIFTQASERQQRIRAMLRDLAPARNSGGSDVLSSVAVDGSGQPSPEPSSRFTDSHAALTNAQLLGMPEPHSYYSSSAAQRTAAASSTPGYQLRPTFTPPADTGSGRPLATVLNYDSVMETPPIARLSDSTPNAPYSTRATAAVTQAIVRQQQDQQMQPPPLPPSQRGTASPRTPASASTTPMSGGGTQAQGTPVAAAQSAVADPQPASPMVPSVGFNFGQQQIFVSGPPMHQQLQLYPDGTLTTIHSPYPPNSQQHARLELSATSGQPAGEHNGQLALSSGAAVLALSPRSPRQQEPLTLALQPADTELLAKYKKAKKLLQSQLSENDSLKQQLVSEAKRVAVLEARLGALGSPAELSSLLASTQADRLVAISKLQEANAQLESERATIRTLKAQVEAADSDKQQLLEAFIKERAKRESEALTARRALESQLEAAVAKYQAAEQLSESHSQHEVAAQARVAELLLQMREIQAQSHELQQSKEAAEGHLQQLQQKQSMVEDSGMKEMQAVAQRMQQEHEAALKQQQLALQSALQSVEGRHEKELAMAESRLQKAVAELQVQHALALTAMTERHETALRQQTARHDAVVTNLDEQLRMQVELREADEATIRLQCAEVDAFNQQVTQLQQELKQAVQQVQVQEQQLQQSADSHKQQLLQLHEQMQERDPGVQQQRQQQQQQVDELERKVSLLEAASAEQRVCSDAQQAELCEQLAAARQQVEGLEADLQEQQEAQVQALDALQAAHEQGLKQLHALHSEATRRLQQQHTALQEQVAMEHQEQLKSAQAAAEQAQRRLDERLTLDEKGQRQLEDASAIAQTLLREQQEARLQLEAAHARQMAEADRALKNLQEEFDALQEQYEHAQRQQLEETSRAMERLQTAEEAVYGLRRERSEAEQHKARAAAAEATLQRMLREQDEARQQQAEAQRQLLSAAEEASQRLHRQQMLALEETLQRQHRQQLAAAQQEVQRLHRQQLAAAQDELRAQNKQQLVAMEEAIRRQHREQLAEAEQALEAQQRQQAADAEAALQRLQAEMEDAMQGQQEAHDQQLAKAGRSKQRLRAKYEEVLRQRDDLQEQLAEADAAEQSLQESLAQIQQQLADEQTRCNQAQEQVQAAKAELATAKVQLEKAEQQYASVGKEADEKLQVAEAALIALKSEKRAAEEAIRNLQAEHEALQSKQDEARQQQLMSLQQLHTQQLATAQLEHQAQLHALGEAEEHRRRRVQQSQLHMLLAGQSTVEAVIGKVQRTHEMRLLQVVQQLDECDVRVAQAAAQGHSAMSHMAAQLQMLQHLVEEQQEEHEREVQRLRAQVEGRQRLLDEALHTKEQAESQSQRLAEELAEMHVKAEDVSTARVGEQQEVESLLRQVLELHQRLQELGEETERRVDDSTAAARHEAERVVAANALLRKTEERMGKAEADAKQLRWQVQELTSEVEMLQRDMADTQAEAEQCARDLAEAQHQLRIRNTELDGFRAVILQAERMASEAQQREFLARAELDATSDALREQQLRAMQQAQAVAAMEEQQQLVAQRAETAVAEAERRQREAELDAESAVLLAEQQRQLAVERAEASEALAEQQQQALQLTVHELRTELQQLHQASYQQKQEVTSEMSGMVQELRAEISAVGTELKHLAEQNRAVGPAQVSNQPSAEPGGGSAGRSAGRQTVLLDAMAALGDAGAAGRPDALQQQLAEERLVLRNMLSRVENLEEASRPTPRQNAVHGQGNAAHLAMDFHRALDEINESCEQVAYISEVLSIVEVYSAAMGRSSSPGSRLQPAPVRTAQAGPSTAMQSKAAVAAAAAASGVSESEVEQLLSPWGLELMLGYQQVIRTALAEVRRVQALAATAVSELAAQGQGDEADSALSETMHSRLGMHQTQLHNTQERIKHAIQLIETAVDMQARQQQAKPRGQLLAPPATTPALASVTPSAVSNSDSRTSTRPSIYEGAPPMRTTKSTLSQPPPRPVEATTPVAMTSGLSTSPTPPGSSPPRPRSWAWPRDASVPPVQHSSSRDFPTAASAASSLVPSARSARLTPDRLRLSQPSLHSEPQTTTSTQLAALQSSRRSPSPNHPEAYLASAYGGASASALVTTALDGAQLLERLAARRIERQQRQRQQQQVQQHPQQAKVQDRVLGKGSESAARKADSIIGASGRALPAAVVRISGDAQVPARNLGAGASSLRPSARAISMSSAVSGQASSLGHVLGPEFGLLTPGVTHRHDKPASRPLARPGPAAHGSTGSMASEALITADANAVRLEAGASSHRGSSSYTSSYERLQKLSKLKNARQLATLRL